MTREEMGRKRELKKAVEKDFLRPISKNDIVSENYESALAKTEEELSNKHSGGFVSSRGGDIYEYVKRYCKNHL